MTWNEKRRAAAAHRTAVETAWAIHASQADWTGKVDGKATFAFAAESAAIATVVALTAEDRLYSQLSESWMWTIYAVGLTGMIVAAGLSVTVVIPRLRTKNVDRESRENFIYFGHARLWQPEALERAMRGQDILPHLTRQIVAMARISWRKHVLVQWSLLVAVTAGLLLVGAGLLASANAPDADATNTTVIQPSPTP